MALEWPHCVPLESPNVTEALQYSLDLWQRSHERSRQTLDQSLRALEDARLEYVLSEMHYFKSAEYVTAYTQATVSDLLCTSAGRPAERAPPRHNVVHLLGWMIGYVLAAVLMVVRIAPGLINIWVTLGALRLAFSLDAWWALWRMARLPDGDKWFDRLLWCNVIVSGAYLVRLALIIGLDWALPWPPAVRVVWHSLLCVLEWHELGRLALDWISPRERRAEAGPHFTFQRALWRFAVGVWVNVLFLAANQGVDVLLAFMEGK